MRRAFPVASFVLLLAERRHPEPAASAHFEELPKEGVWLDGCPGLGHCFTGSQSSGLGADCKCGRRTCR